MQPVDHDLEILQGATFQHTMQWFNAVPAHTPITAVEAGWPTVVTADGHGIAVGTRSPVWITNVRVPKRLNTERPGSCDPVFATAMDINTLAVDRDTASEQGAYSGNGILTTFPINNLTGYTADLQIRRAPGDQCILLEMSTTNGAITLDTATGEITLTLTSTQTAAVDWTQAVYDLLLTSSTGFVTRLAQGQVKVVHGVTQAPPA